MDVQYRRMRLQDEGEVVTLWANTFGGKDPERARRYIRLDPHYLDHTLIAASSDGMVLATLHYWLHYLRDADGTPQLVGCVSHVTTREEARRQGYAARLLQMSFEAMLSDGCMWTLLSSSQMGVPLYERYGYRHCSLPYRRGILIHRVTQNPGKFAIERAALPSDWKGLAEVYAAYNARRPLTLVRDRIYWDGQVQMEVSRMVESRNGVIYTANSASGDLCGYLIAYFTTGESVQQQFNMDHLFTVSELCVLPGHEDAISALLYAATSNVPEDGVAARFFLPYDDRVNEAAQRIFGPTLSKLDDRSMMARPLSPHITYEEIQAMFSAPGAHLWPIDDF